MEALVGIVLVVVEEAIGSVSGWDREEEWLPLLPLPLPWRPWRQEEFELDGVKT